MFYTTLVLLFLQMTKRCWMLFVRQMADRGREGALVLEDGTRFSGTLFGAALPTAGEVGE